MFYSSNETQTISEQFRTAAQQEKCSQRIMGSPEQGRVSEQPPPPPPPPAPSTTNYNNLPPDLVQQLQNLPVLVEPGSRNGRPRRSIPAPAPAPAPALLTMEQLTAQHAALPYLVQPGRHGRPKKTIPGLGPAPALLPAIPLPGPAPALLPAIPLPALAPAPAVLTSAQLAAQYAALPPDPLEHVRHGRPRRTIPAPAPAPVPFEELAAQYAALPPVCFFYFILLIVLI